MKKSVCVYCASSARVPQHYLNAARDFGRMLAENRIHCIYGGGYQGLMGYLAESVLSAGGKITGIIPDFMCEREWQHPHLPELVITKSMHARKEMMLRRADAAVALPGGIGTFEELVEAITWHKLGLFPKPVFILNTNGFYNPLLQMFENAVNEKFMEEEDRNLWTVADTVETLIEQLKNA